MRTARIKVHSVVSNATATLLLGFDFRCCGKADRSHSADHTTLKFREMNVSTPLSSFENCTQDLPQEIR
jgi:hypothetical protein